jgi:hypothetical protein
MYASRQDGPSTTKIAKLSSKVDPEYDAIRKAKPDKLRSSQHKLTALSEFSLSFRVLRPVSAQAVEERVSQQIENIDDRTEKGKTKSRKRIKSKLDAYNTITKPASRIQSSTPMASMGDPAAYAINQEIKDIQVANTHATLLK